MSPSEAPKALQTLECIAAQDWRLVRLGGGGARRAAPRSMSRSPGRDKELKVHPMRPRDTSGRATRQATNAESDRLCPKSSRSGLVHWRRPCSMRGPHEVHEESRKKNKGSQGSRQQYLARFGLTELGSGLKYREPGPPGTAQSGPVAPKNAGRTDSRPNPSSQAESNHVLLATLHRGTPRTGATLHTANALVPS